MKGATLFAVLLFSTFSVFSQSVKISLGNEIDKEELDKINIGQKSFARQEIEGRSRYNYFLNRKDKLLYMGIARDENKRYRFGVFKNYTTLSDSRIMQLEMPGMEGASYTFIKMDEINGRRFLFYTTGKDETNALYVNQVDDNFVILGSPIKLMEEKGKYQGFSVHISENKKSVLIFQSGVGDYDDDKSTMATLRENKSVSAIMLDNQFSEVWRTEFELPFRLLKGDIDNVKVDNAGNMYLLTYMGKAKDQLATLYQYYWKTKELKKSAVGKPGVRTWGCLFDVLKGTTPVVAGLYGNDKRNGHFVTVFDPASMTSKEIVNKPFMKDYELWDGFIRAEFYSIRHLAMTENNNITFSVEGAVQMSGSTNASVYTFLFSPAFVKQVDINGKDVWQKVIRKSQIVPVVPNCGSHALLAKGNDIVVLYADHADNAGRGADDKKPKVYRREKSIVISQRIDEGGKVSKELVKIINPKGDFGLDSRVMIPLENNLYLTEFWNIDGGIKSWSYKYATVEID